MRHLTLEELEAGLDEIRRAPADAGVVELIVRRPGTELREILAEGVLDLEEGLVGDRWSAHGSSSPADRSEYRGRQLTLVNARAIALIAQERERWQFAGDQLFVDMDLSADNLPPGTRLAVGAAVIEVSDEPHTGCAKYAARFGTDALKFVNSAVGRSLQLRGINASIVQSGAVRVGDVARKL